MKLEDCETLSVPVIDIAGETKIFRVIKYEFFSVQFCQARVLQTTKKRRTLTSVDDKIDWARFMTNTKLRDWIGVRLVAKWILNMNVSIVRYRAHHLVRFYIANNL